jgi:hypothetical protein
MKKSAFLITVMIFGLCMGTIPTIAETLVLQPGSEGKDTYVCDCLPTVNNPNGPITNLYQGQYGKCYDRLFIQWDLSSLPANITITSAIMDIRCSGLYGSLSGQMVYYLITEDWDESTVSYSTCPEFTTQDSVVATWPKAAQWHSVDITKYMQKWCGDGTTNHGIYGHCAATTGQCCAQFSSSDVSTAANRPKLTITYTTAAQVENLNGPQPVDFTLSQNYPNPFNPGTTIRYSLPHEEFVTLKIYDIVGNEVTALVNQRQDAGIYQVIFNGSRLASGLYLYKIEAGDYSDIKKFILFK